MVVVMVDGWPTDRVEEASRLARESGINIFFVTIEAAAESEKQNVIEPNFVDKVLTGLGSDRELQTTFSKLFHSGHFPFLLTTYGYFLSCLYCLEVSCRKSQAAAMLKSARG